MEAICAAVYALAAGAGIDQLIRRVQGASGACSSSSKLDWLMSSGHGQHDVVDGGHLHGCFSNMPSLLCRALQREHQYQDLLPSERFPSLCTRWPLIMRSPPALILSARTKLLIVVVVVGDTLLHHWQTLMELEVCQLCAVARRSLTRHT